MMKGKSRRKGAQPRRVPERTCIACRTKRPKRSLVRVVRTPTGEVIVDEKGKANGRGAYLCAQRSCWETALQHRSLNRALRAAPTPEELQTLEAYAASLPTSLESTDSSAETEEA